MALCPVADSPAEQRLTGVVDTLAGLSRAFEHTARDRLKLDGRGDSSGPPPERNRRDKLLLLLRTVGSVLIMKSPLVSSGSGQWHTCCSWAEQQWQQWQW